MTEKDYKNKLKDELISYRTSLCLPKEVTFGIEIEYENIVKDTISYLITEENHFNSEFKDWKNKSEIDIMEYNKFGEEMNGEINSPILLDNIITWKNLNIMCNILDRNGAVTTEKCGGHINIGAHVLGENPKYWRNFLLLWILYEKEIYKFSSGEYNRIRNVKPNLIKKISKVLNLNQILDVENGLYLASLGPHAFKRDYDIRLVKFPINMINFENRIEFRVPNGSLCKEIWQNYINFFAKFVLACKKELDVERTLYKINNNEHSAVELANYVFDNDIDIENFLIQTLKTNKIYKKELRNHIIY